MNVFRSFSDPLLFFDFCLLFFLFVVVLVC